MHARDYRKEAYRLRSHPSPDRAPTLIDSRNSFSMVYTSLLPFVGLELMAEAMVAAIPGGLVFPMGFLLFWAFYYTYYRPGLLEANLSTRQSWRVWNIPSLLLGALIWVIKTVVVELGEFVFFQPWKKVGNEKPLRPSHNGSTRFRTPPSRTPQPSNEPPLPRDVERSLCVLGLPNCRNWSEIHRRYRVLAKQYHPDLNPDSTGAGHRFMVYDAAFKKLAPYRLQYFSKKPAY